MRTLIVGAGAVGGYFGALMRRGGADVTFLARGNHARAIRERGLRVAGVAGEWGVRAPVVEALDGARGFDLVLVAAKAFSIREVAPALPGVLEQHGIAMSLCNGIGAEQALEAVISRARVVGATALIGAERVAPGVVRHDARGILVVGEPWLPGGGQAARVARFLLEHGVPVEVREDIARAKWWKMAWNCAFNPISALTGWTVGEVMADGESRNLVRAVVGEVAAVARVAGVDLGDDIADRLLSQNADLGHVRTSMLQDLEAGRPTENEDLSGEIVRRARAAHIAVPASASLYERIRQREGAPPRGTGGV